MQAKQSWGCLQAKLSQVVNEVGFGLGATEMVL